jgi:hypothetical protein
MHVNHVFLFIELKRRTIIMKATKALVAAGLAVMLGAGTAMAAEGPNVGKIGIGYQGMMWGEDWTESALNGISARYWINDNVGIQGTLFYGRTEETDSHDTDQWSTLEGAVKVMYAPVVKENSRVYIGLQGALGRDDFEDDNEDFNSDFWQIMPLVGFEYNIPGLKEIGFNAEVGYAFNSYDTANVSSHHLYWDDDYDDSGVVVSVGAHYYL